MYMKVILLLAVVLAIVALQQGAQAKCFSTICGSNSKRDDNCGKGHYGAPRRNSDGTKRKHRGFDILCAVDSNVYSPFDATVVREARPTVSTATYNTGVLLQGRGSDWSDFKVWLFYVEKTVDDNTQVNAGDKIGEMLDMTGKCTSNTMKNHVHVKVEENGNLRDPEDYIC